MRALNIAHVDDTFTLASVENLTLGLWRDAPTVEQLRRFEPVTRSLHERFECSGLINIIESGSPRFDGAVREETARQTRLGGDANRFTAHVVELAGLAGATTRAFLSTSFLLARSRSLNQVFVDVAAAAQWAAPRLTHGAVTWAPEQIASLTDALRRASAGH